MVGTANNRRTIYTKKAIREAFLHLLELKEVEKITVKEITDLADINRGTFYKYYKDTFDLLQKIEEEILSDLLGQIQLNDQPMEYWLTALLEKIEDSPEVRILVLGNNTRTLLIPLLERIKPKTFKHFLQFFPEATTDEMELYLAYFVEGSVGLITRWLKDYKTMSAQKVCSLLLSVYRTEIY
ncbi:TetR family transcriptional regulator [Enterococcus florum]|uniref:TetR family transcriptional regulator n=1 Tax=Enterococcus florum TaxID=2480627 RepID=A0A4V0WP83_9ENTE|nr:TetR/AcrR family transcriptional regulator [Enterococcus florum]GCF92959.1 TetR family transcriptional regulator [Enterococcus florum]